MKETTQLDILLTDDPKGYANRLKALKAITDEQQLRFLAEEAKDEWIRLEAAILGNIEDVLQELAQSADERIKLEALISLNAQQQLTDMVINSKEGLHRQIARNYIDNEECLLKIARHAISETARVEAVIQLGESSLGEEILNKLQNEKLHFQIADAFGNTDEILRLANSAENVEVKKQAKQWLEEQEQEEFNFD